IEEDEKAARLYFTRLNQLFKEAADEAGLDSSQYDVFELLEPLKENQQSMSDKEKEDRLAAAQLAYEDVIIDDIVSVTNGITKEDKQRIEDKKEEVKAQYGRVLLFDPDNVKANKALGDIYLKEGKQDDAEVFLKRALKNADKEEYSKIKSKIRQKAIDNLKIKKVPEEKGLFLALKKSAEQANEKIQANINRKEEEINNWYNSFKISKSMKDIWEDANEIIFSASEKKAKEAAEE
ncbi:hypothetical protein ISS07_00005, partial [Candidatus Woesearchaeota archaeon]|nr:hypothetical protein [Candidatus Woesearchaeota archaeon]